MKTTYYEADPSEVTGLNEDALGVLINPDSANSCKEMKIKNWDAALYEFDEHSYLCWTDTPEISYVLEYNPDVVPDEEIIRMAESAERIKKTDAESICSNTHLFRRVFSLTKAELSRKI